MLPAKNDSVWDKRMEVVGRYMLLGNLRLVSEQTGVHYNTLVEWKKSEWWPEVVAQLRQEKKSKQNANITKLIEQSLDVMADRLENGDYVLNNKTGQVVRKPVGVKEATTIAHQLLQRQTAIEELENKMARSEDTVQETLSLLAKEFQKWNKLKNNNAEDIPFVEVVSTVRDNYKLAGETSAVHDQREARLQEGSGSVHEQA